MADDSYPKAQNQLGVYYRDGIGVGTDPVLAYAWFSTALNHGFSKATDNLKELEKTLSADQLMKGKLLGEQYTLDYKSKPEE